MRSLFTSCQPALPSNWRTVEGEWLRQPSSPNRWPATYQFSPEAFDPPCSNSSARRAALPNTAWMLVPGSLRPSLVWIASAPPSVFSPNSGFEPGISAIDDKAMRGIRSQLTTSPNGWFSRTPSM